MKTKLILAVLIATFSFTGVVQACGQKTHHKPARHVKVVKTPHVQVEEQKPVEQPVVATEVVETPAEIPATTPTAEIKGDSIEQPVFESFTGK